MIMTNLIKVVDKYNNNKVWLIKRKASGNYYYNQEICGRKTNEGFVRTTKKFLEDLLEIDPLILFDSTIENIKQLSSEGFAITFDNHIVKYERA